MGAAFGLLTDGEKEKLRTGSPHAHAHGTFILTFVILFYLSIIPARPRSITYNPATPTLLK